MKNILGLSKHPFYSCCPEVYDFAGFWIEKAWLSNFSRENAFATKPVCLLLWILLQQGLKLCCYRAKAAWTPWTLKMSGVSDNLQEGPVVWPILHISDFGMRCAIHTVSDRRHALIGQWPAVSSCGCGYKQWDAPSAAAPYIDCPAICFHQLWMRCVALYQLTKHLSMLLKW